MSLFLSHAVSVGDPCALINIASRRSVVCVIQSDFLHCIALGCNMKSSKRDKNVFFGLEFNQRCSIISRQNTWLIQILILFPNACHNVIESAPHRIWSSNRVATWQNNMTRDFLGKYYSIWPHGMSAERIYFILTFRPLSGYIHRWHLMCWSSHLWSHTE